MVVREDIAVPSSRESISHNRSGPGQSLIPLDEFEEPPSSGDDNSNSKHGSSGHPTNHQIKAPSPSGSPAPASSPPPPPPHVASSPFRMWIRTNIVKTPWFDPLVMLVIVANCATLAMANPRFEDDPSKADLIEFLDVTELVFAIIFTLEMLFKFAALGLFNERGYFKDNWNILDFVIVIGGYLVFVPGVGNFTGIRILRVLRPLRSVNKLPGLQIIVNTLLDSVSGLVDVGVILLFLFAIFAIVGIQLWNGSLHQRCFLTTDTTFSDPLDFCSRSGKGYVCPAGQVCLYEGPSPNAGLTGFDNAGQAMLTIFTSITLAGWGETMFAIQDTSGPWAWVYFLFLTLVVSFFALNLILAVVDDKFGEFAEEQRERDAAIKKKRDSVILESATFRDLNRAVEFGRRMSQKLAHDDSQPMLDTIEEYSMSDSGYDDDDEDMSRTYSGFASATSQQPLADRPLQTNASLESLGSVSSDVMIGELSQAEYESQMTRMRNLNSIVEHLDNIKYATEHRANAQKTALDTPDIAFHELASLVLPLVRRQREEMLFFEQYLKRQHWIVDKIYAFVEAALFQRFIIAVIVINTVLLSLDHHDIDSTFLTTLEVLNNICTSIFILEMALKLIAYSPEGYVRDPWNTFDGFIVIVSVIEWAMSGGGGGGALSAIRSFRLLRVFKLAKSFKSLRILLNTVLSSLSSVGYMTGLLLLFMFMFAVLGMQLFSGKWKGHPDPPRSRYDTFYWSMITVFQVLTGDDWTGLMGQAVEATSEGAIIYYLLLTILGGFMVVSLFIAILLTNFDNQDSDAFELEDIEDEAFALVRVKPYNEERVLKTLVRRLGEIRIADFEASLETERLVKEEKRAVRRMEGLSFGIFPPQSDLRRFCWGLCTSWPFEWFIIWAIIANCLFLAFESPSATDEEENLFFIMDVVFAVIFTVEMIIKCIAMGVYKNKHSYLSDSWNRLDGAVVLFALVSLAFPGVSAVRSFRALRPIRVVVRSKQIKVVVTSLYRALPAILNVCLFCLLFWLIFAILSVNLFGGKLYSCTTDDSLDKAACLTAGGEWANADFHYDNVYEAIVTLFQVASMSGWGDIMYEAVDATSHDEAPETNAHPEAAVFFIVFVIVGAFFTLNLFVGVVIDNFNRLKQELSGSAFLTAEQRAWVKTQKIIQGVELEAQVPRPADPVRGLCYTITQHPYFDPLIMWAIIANVLIMLVQHWDQEEAVTDTLFGLNMFFVALFTAEAVMKIAALSWSPYWADPWNKFDFIVVIASLIGLVANTGVGANVVRVFRIGRVLRLIKKAESLKKQFNTLMLSLPSLGNISLLLFVIFFIYAVLAVSFFGDTPRTEDGLTRNLNLENWPNAMLSMYIMATGDGWEQVMLGARVKSGWSTIFFVSFMIVGSLVMVNLFIAVILENFGEEDEEDDGIGEATKDRIRSWARSWNSFDPEASKTIDANQFEAMMSEAPMPFGFGVGRKMPMLNVLRRLQQSQVPIFKEFRRGVGKKNFVWRARFEPTLRALAAIIRADEDDTETGGVEDAWDCSCTSVVDFFFNPDNKSTMDVWYAVHIIETNWIATKKARSEARRAQLRGEILAKQRGRATGEPSANSWSENPDHTAIEMHPIDPNTEIVDKEVPKYVVSMPGGLSKHQITRNINQEAVHVDALGFSVGLSDGETSGSSASSDDSYFDDDGEFD